MLRIALVISTLFVSTLLLTAQSSVLASGKWIKMTFEAPGVYKINFNLLTEMGFSPSQVTPQNLAIYGHAGGMLPQANSIARPNDLEEIAIWVEGEQDNVFHQNDYILFYVDSPDKITFDSNNQSFSVEKNLYSREIFYFLTEKESKGKRITEQPNLGATNPSYNWHNEITHHEKELVNLLQSGRAWFGENMGAQTSLSFPISTENLAAGELKLRVNAVAQSYNSSSISVTLGEQEVGHLNFEALPNTQYGVKANVQSLMATRTLNGEESDLDLQLEYDKNGTSNAIAYLDAFTLDLPRKNIFEGETLTIRNALSVNNTISTFNIESANATPLIWNVTDHNTVINQLFSQANNTITFGDFSSEIQTYVIFNPEEIPSPSTFEELSNQDLHSQNNAELVIISHPNFVEQAQRMAQFRSSEGMSVLVTTPAEIYNEFSAGRPDVVALRDFLRYLYLKGNLKYALFFGKGSYDFQNRVTELSNYVPTYESKNSIHPLLTYSSDDFFGFMDENEGEWIESTAGDHTVDIGIGRIPATNPVQAQFYVDKWIDYQTDFEAKGTWRQEIVFVADDGDGNLHNRDADFLAGLIEENHANFKVNKLYLDSFLQEQLPNGESSPDAEEALLNAANEGALVINFTGHGAESGWMQERILTFELMNQWDNPNNLPFLVTATCEFGRNDDPQVFSGAENLLFKEVGGAIGLVTTARPVFSSSNFNLNQAIYAKMFEKENGHYPTLGQIIQYTKNNSLEGSLNRNFILLGDPSMQLAYPDKEVNLNTVNDIEVTTALDTLSAFESVTITGYVESQNQIESQFNGTLYFELIDKPQQKQTLGNGSPVFEFTEQDQVLFKGKASIINGEFEGTFVVPQNIDYQYGKGKLQFYALSDHRSQDAIGGSQEFVLGGTGTIENKDETPPTIQLYLNDFSEPIKDNYEGNVILLGHLSDESGINISNLGFGQNITLTVNDTSEFILNDVYNTTLDDFTSGTLSFPLTTLVPGQNQIQLKAWDNAGNSNAANLIIDINENSSIITEIKNHPNPLESETEFSIEHTLIGENVDVNIELLTINGQPITAFSKSFTNAERVLSIPWVSVNNEGTQLKKGLYIYNVQIRSNSSGKADSKRKKLVISY